MAYTCLIRWSQSTAIEIGFVLSTKNRKHFSMIGGLSVEVPTY